MYISYLLIFLYNIYPFSLEITNAIVFSVEYDDLHVFLEALHLLSDTYMFFSDYDNAVFAYNQLVNAKLYFRFYFILLEKFLFFTLFLFLIN